MGPAPSYKLAEDTRPYATSTAPSNRHNLTRMTRCNFNLASRPQSKSYKPCKEQMTPGLGDDELFRPQINTYAVPFVSIGIGNFPSCQSKLFDGKET